jgi:hypothetical protein
MVMNNFENRSFMQRMGRKAQHVVKMPSFFFLLSFGLVGGRIFFHFSFVPNMFLSGSQCVPQGVFPIASCFNPICFAQSPPLLTYIGGPKGEALLLSIKFGPIKDAHHNQFLFFELWGLPSTN